MRNIIIQHLKSAKSFVTEILIRRMSKYVWWALRQRISRHNEHFAKFRYQEKRSSHITHVCRHHVRPNSCTCSHEREVSPKKSNGILAANAITVAEIKSDYVQYLSKYLVHQISCVDVWRSVILLINILRW